MSLNSFETNSVQTLLDRSLSAIQRDVPSQYLAICRAMQGLTVALTVDRERFSLSSDGKRIELRAAAEEGMVALCTLSRVVESVIDNRLDLIDALLGDAIVLRGNLDPLTQFNEALTEYVHGAVRSSTVDEVLSDFRALAKRRFLENES